MPPINRQISSQKRYLEILLDFLLKVAGITLQALLESRYVVAAWCESMTVSAPTARSNELRK